jgi:hypothetical protein
MSAWPALRPMATILAIVAVILLAMAGLTSIDKADLLIPTPEGAAAQMVGALGAHRAAGARGQLAKDLQEQVDEGELLALIRNIEAGPLRGIEDAHEVSSEEQGGQVVAQVRVKFGDLSEHILEFPLRKENGLWKVSSLDPLDTLPKGASQK